MVQSSHEQGDSTPLEEAAEWLMRLNDSDVTDEERGAWAIWRESSPERAQAWSRAELLMGKMAGLPPALAMPALDRPASPDRRAAIAKLAVMLALVPAGWKLAQWQGWTTDYHTAVGERREITLADGSQITLNTDSAIDVRYDAGQRFIRLLRGEILVQTSPDNQVPRRPFLVETTQGRMEALGTRFTVREGTGRTHLAVLEGAVRVEPASAGLTASQVVHAGQQTRFTARNADPVSPADKSAEAWTQGMLKADRMRLADFAAELARYRHGFIRCEPAIADLRVSGVFPVNDIEQALNMLVSTYPLAATVRMNGYWILLSAR
ncbi:FecR family protein [Pseudomonas sp. LFM046]|uniref:FecR domain-containing protein n=1 Tax=Pseudomonas sp. LFM046 TaxID=1608357 RepID=UPI0005CFACF2|nr:FecR family protein [Pseudomonas sp. LFM046]